MEAIREHYRSKLIFFGANIKESLSVPETVYSAKIYLIILRNFELWEKNEMLALQTKNTKNVLKKLISYYSQPVVKGKFWLRIFTLKCENLIFISEQINAINFLKPSWKSWRKRFLKSFYFFLTPCLLYTAHISIYLFQTPGKITFACQPFSLVDVVFMTVWTYPEQTLFQQFRQCSVWAFTITAGISWILSCRH